MKLIVIKDNLKEAVGAAGALRFSDQTLPVLKNVHLSAKQGKIILRATNLELGVEFVVPGKIIEEGETTIPIGALYSIVGSLQSDRINIESRGAQTTIKTDNYEAVLQGLPAEDFPIIPEVKNEGRRIEVKGTVLKEALQQTIIASQFSDLRPELYNALVHFRIDEVKIVATDSFRLAEKTLTKNLFNATAEEEFKVLIPIPTTQELMPLLGEEPLSLFKDDHQVVFVAKNWKIVSRLYAGEFPNYEPIIPQGFKAEVIVSRLELQEALKLSSVFGGQLQEVCFRMKEGQKGLEVFSESQGVGKNAYRLNAKINKPLSSEMIFNAKYLNDALKAISGEEIFLGIGDEGKPILLRSPRDNSYFYILMPVLKS